MLSVCGSEFFCSNMLNHYLDNDWVKKLVSLDDSDSIMAADFGCNQWLIDSPPKRMIFSHVYGDLFPSKKSGNPKKLRILDVGAGVNLAQRVLAKHHDLTVLELFAHDQFKTAERYFTDNGINYLNGDWFQKMDELGEFDIIIANDLFPNVDQRLKEFLQKAQEHTRRIRIMLTFYNNSRFYNVKRVDADEFMCLRAWDGKNVADTVTNAMESSDDLIGLRKQIEGFESSIFPNQRICMLLEMVSHEKS